MEIKRQKQIQMSVMAVAMQCGDINFDAEDEELLPPPEKRFKVRNSSAFLTLAFIMVYLSLGLCIVMICIVVIGHSLYYTL